MLGLQTRPQHCRREMLFDLFCEGWWTAINFVSILVLLTGYAADYLPHAATDAATAMPRLGNQI